MKKIILLAMIAIILVISVLLLLPRLRGYSLAINPNEVYRISWWSAGSRHVDSIQGETSARDEIETIVEYLNSLALVRRAPRYALCGCSYTMGIFLFDGEGNRKKSISIYSGNRYIIWNGYDGFHRIICCSGPLTWFVRIT